MFVGEQLFCAKVYGGKFLIKYLILVFLRLYNNVFVKLTFFFHRYNGKVEFLYNFFDYKFKVNMALKWCETSFI